MIEDSYGQQAIANALHTDWAGKRLLFYDEIDSTNLQAEIAANQGAREGLLIVADRQTAGRGRRGRDWSSPAGCNIYFSLLLRPEFSLPPASMTTLVMALAVARGIRRTCAAEETNIGIKWPNDIVAKGRKLCGILTEMKPSGEGISHIVIGVGINVARQGFDPAIASTAISLEEVCGRRVPRAKLLANILEAFENYYKKFCATENMTPLLEEYNRLLVNRDRQVRVLDPKGEYEGISKGINAAGELIVETRDGKLAPVYAGEVSVRGIYGYV